jgi:hypothetical protein
MASDVSDECGIGAKHLLAHFVYLIFTLHRPAVCTPLVGLHLKWKPHHIESSIYSWNLYLEVYSACINILCTSAGSKTDARMYRLIKNKQSGIATFSRPALETTNFLIQWVQGFFPRSTAVRM